MMPSDMELEASEQPDSVEFSFEDGVFVKSGFFKLAGRIVPQHSHDYPHATFIATGSVAAWAGEEYLGEFHAPSHIPIKAKTKHLFKTLEDNTLIYCIHNVMRNGMVDIHELHEVSFS